jgi:hypothetical protein
MPVENDITERLLDMSAGELMATVSELVVEDKQISQLALSGLFRKLAEEYYTSGMGVSLAKEKARGTLEHAALALDNCKDPKDPDTYDDALAYLNDEMGKETPSFKHGRHFTAIQIAVARGY